MRYDKEIKLSFEVFRVLCKPSFNYNLQPDNKLTLI